MTTQPDDLAAWLLDLIDAEAADARREADSPSSFEGIRYNPARVLDECDSKRHIIREHRHLLAQGATPAETASVCWSCTQPYPCQTLRLLAMPYQGQPGFRDEWLPTVSV